MSTKKLKRFKNAVTAILVSNFITSIICDIAVCAFAIKARSFAEGMLILMVSAFNATAVLLMSELRDACISELEDRKILKIKEVKSNGCKNKRKNVKSA